VSLSVALSHNAWRQAQDHSTFSPPQCYEYSSTSANDASTDVMFISSEGPCMLSATKPRDWAIGAAFVMICGWLKLSSTFYRAKPSGARYCQGKLFVRLSVCPSVRPSVCDVEVSWSTGHIGWDSAKLISPLISLTFFTLCRPQHDWSTLKGTPLKFSLNRSGVLLTLTQSFESP